MDFPKLLEISFLVLFVCFISSVICLFATELSYKEAESFKRAEIIPGTLPENYSDHVLVVLDKKVAVVMAMLFDVDEKEYNVCMFGTLQNDSYDVPGVTKVYRITQVKPAKSIESNETMVHYKDCGNGTLITTHKHPGMAQFPSTVDFNTHVGEINDGELRKEALLGIQYDRYSYRFYPYGEDFEWVKYTFADLVGEG